MIHSSYAIYVQRVHQKICQMQTRETKREKKWVRGFKKQMGTPNTQRIGQRAEMLEPHKH